MDYKDVAVIHEKYGEGIVVEQEDDLIIVQFQDITKKFKASIAFKNSLVAIDAEVQKQIIDQNRAIESKQLSKKAHNADIEEDESLLYGEAKSYVVLKDGTQVFYSISSSFKKVRVSFFKVENGKAKTACIELPDNNWVECINYTKKEITDIRLFCATYGTDIINQATNDLHKQTDIQRKEFVDDLINREKAFQRDSRIALNGTLKALDKIQDLANTDEYAYSIENDIRTIFAQIEQGITKAKEAFVLDPMNKIGLYNLRGEYDQYDATGNKKLVYCKELNAAYETLSQASAYTGVNSGNISSAAKGKLKSAGGFHWEYRSESELPSNVNTGNWPDMVSEPIEIEFEDSEYYTSFPYRKRYYVNDDGYLCFEVPEIPNCEGQIYNIYSADREIKQTIAISIRKAIQEGKDMKKLSELTVKKTEMPLYFRAAAWPDLLPISIESKVMVECIEETDPDKFTAALNGIIKSLGCIRDSFGYITDRIVPLTHLRGETLKAFIIYEGLVCYEQ